MTGRGDSYFIPAFTKYSYFISTHLSMLVVHKIQLIMDSAVSNLVKLDQNIIHIFP